MSEQELMERVEAYLDGRLSLEQTARLEAELLQGGAAARLLSEELMLRELLGSMPPEQPPEGLVARIRTSLPLGLAPRGLPAEPDSEGRNQGMLAQLGLVLGGASWSLRGLAMAQAAGGSGIGGRATLDGMSTARYALGPLAAGLDLRRSSSPRKKKPRWRSAAGLLWKRLGKK